MARESALLATLRPALERYDYILIDCLPSLGLIAINALRAADGVVIPVQADFLAVQGLAQILETISAVREQLNPKLSVYGVLLTMVDIKNSHAQRVIATVRHSLKGQVPVFGTQIGMDWAYKEAAELGRSVLATHGGASANSYRRLAREVAYASGDTAVEPFKEPRPGVLELLGRLWRGLTLRGQVRPSVEPERTLAGVA
jgi:chromosome partitioning protein